MKNIIKVPNILLPKQVDMKKWACVACDQFTSEPEYWDELSKFVDGSPSALNLIYPEVYLSSNDAERIKSINNAMENYYNSDMFEEFQGFVLVERTLPSGEVRLGLMLAVDLEQYDYSEKNTAMIKATEKTVVERLPSRINVRRNASLELPHIMILMDNAQKNIIEEIYSCRESFEVAYDTDLNMKGGHIKGYKIKNCDEIIDRIIKLVDDTAKYGSADKILFAVGDGNHSLATAKECWNLAKASLNESELAGHPNRYALCELVNLHDDSLVFEPIHRVVFGAGVDFVNSMVASLNGDAEIKVVYEDKIYKVSVPSNPSDAIKDIQDYIDSYIEENCNVVQDYIHGDNNLLTVAKREHGVAIYMPTIAKDSLFEYAVRRGVLPRKSFSMGVAEDKRYYLEARKIK